MSIVVSHLTKIFGEQKAIDDISFQVNPGEILGFLGPNGAGKSTTMKIATCYLPPTSGHVKVCGLDVEENPLGVRKNVGYLPEHNPLYLDTYVHEYLHFIGSLHGMRGKHLKARTEEMVALCGLGLEQNKKIGTLSKGYRQRVGLAQSLIHNPQVLILDEPTSGLDPNQILEIRQVIKEISKEKTVIFSTHIMQEVQALCDRVVIINRGKIVADSDVEQLKAGLKSSQLITVEFKEAIDIEALAALDEIQKVEEISDLKYRIEADVAEDARSAIFKLSADNNWPLIGLNEEENSLEDIFHQLTQNK